MPDNIGQFYEEWKRSPSQSRMLRVIDSMKPDMDRAIQSASAQPDSLNRGMAKSLVIDAMNSFDPKGGTQFRTWANTQLRQLSRRLRNTRFAVRIPELRARESQRIRSAVAALEAELGFEPSDATLADRLGMSRARVQAIRKYAGPEQIVSEIGSEGVGGLPVNEDLVREVVYQSLGPRDQTIFEFVFGYNGVKPMSARDIAKKMKVTPAAISQRMAIIQRALKDAEGAL